MRLSLSKYHYYWIILWFFVLVYILYSDAILSATIEHRLDFTQNQYGITYIFPLGRTVLTEEMQQVNTEPVYFSVYAPRIYENAYVTIKTENLPSGWSMGVQTAPGFTYSLQPFMEGTENSFMFKIEHVYYKDNRIRFIIAGDTKTAPLIVKSLHVRLEGPAESYASTIKRSLKDLY